MGHVIVREIDRAEPAALDGLARSGVATAHEAAGRIGLLAPAIRPIQSGVRIAGSAITVSCHPGDNLMIHAAIETVRPGDILVVTTTSRSTDGMFGELIATSLVAHGCVGLVMDAGVRDAAELRELGFPVWTRAIHAQGTVKASPGSVNITVDCAGQIVHAGDVVIADDDGVCVLERRTAADVLAACSAREGKEAATREALQQGELGLDRNGLRALLDELGVRYVDRAEDLL